MHVCMYVCLYTYSVYKCRVCVCAYYIHTHKYTDTHTHTHTHKSLRFFPPKSSNMRGVSSWEHVPRLYGASASCVLSIFQKP